nr:SBBP repeat-containing protein [Saprospiraceae bacterium]
MNNFYISAQISFAGLGFRAGKMLRGAVLVMLGLMSTQVLVTAQTLDWNTFTGSTGTGIHEGTAVVTDASGNIYVCGSSNATFGTPINAKSGAYDGILVKYNSSGVRQWHTFFGGSGDDFAFGIDLDPSGNIYISGSSAASWGTPLNAFSADPDGLVIKFNSSGVRQWHTFFGAGFGENAYAIAVDASGNAYVTGNSQTNWGTPVEPYTGGTDGIVLKYNTSGARQWHSFFGGGNNGDRGQGIALDASNNVYITGFSGQSWGSPIVAPAGGSDGIVAKYNGSTGDLVWNTYFGSSGADEG